MLRSPTFRQSCVPTLPRTRVAPSQLWDLAAGKPRTVLTHHKKSVRALAQHAKQFAFIVRLEPAVRMDVGAHPPTPLLYARVQSGSADHLKKWALPDGDFVHNYTGHSSIINCLALNADDVLVSGGDDGTLKWVMGDGTKEDVCIDIVFSLFRCRADSGTMRQAMHFRRSPCKCSRGLWTRRQVYMQRHLMRREGVSCPALVRAPHVSSHCVRHAVDSSRARPTRPSRSGAKTLLPPQSRIRST